MFNGEREEQPTQRTRSSLGVAHVMGVHLHTKDDDEEQDNEEKRRGEENGEHARECMERSVIKRSVTKDQQPQRMRLDGSWEMGVCGTHESTKKKKTRRGREWRA